MNNYINELTDKLYELYKTYESYAWKYNDRRIVIAFQKDRRLSFYLYELYGQKELVDDLHLSFDKLEYDLYKIICLRLFVMIIGNVKIHKLGNEMYYNPIHKPYLLVINKDMELKKMIDEMIVRQDNEILNFDIDIVKDVSKNVKKKKYSKQFLDNIDAHTKLLREILRR